MNIHAFTHMPSAATVPMLGESLAVRLFRYAALRVRLWWAERTALGEIAAMDERSLRDIGVQRWELHEYLRAERERVLMREFGWRARR